MIDSLQPTLSVQTHLPSYLDKASRSSSLGYYIEFVGCYYVGGRSRLVDAEYSRGSGNMTQTFIHPVPALPLMKFHVIDANYREIRDKHSSKRKRRTSLKVDYTVQQRSGILCSTYSNVLDGCKTFVECMCGRFIWR